MTLKEGIKTATNAHVLEAIREVDANGVEWLFEITGRKPPRYRYSEFKGRLYPTKALGHRVAQLAASSTSRENDLTTNTANTPLERAGMIDAELAGEGLTVESQDRLRQTIGVLARPMQSAFRSAALKLWSRRCPISGCSTVEVLEAAHIKPVKEGGSDGRNNAILLRADLHRLFDLDLIALDPSDLSVHVATNVSGDYLSLSNMSVQLPKNGPSRDDFAGRWKRFGDRR